MQLYHLVSLTALFAGLSTAQLNVYAYFSRSCTGAFRACNAMPQGNCCTWSSSYGYSINYSNKPIDSVVTAYATGVCSAGGVNINTCWNASGAWNRRASASWRFLTSRGSSAAAEARAQGAECREANVFGYVKEDGKMVEIVVEMEGGEMDMEMQRLQGMYEAGQWEALESMAK